MVVAWAAVCLAAAGFTLLLFAFADSPALAAAVAKRATPAMVLGLLALGIGGWLIARHATWWQVAIAFALPLMPPMVVATAYDRPK